VPLVETKLVNVYLIIHCRSDDRKKAASLIFPCRKRAAVLQTGMWRLPEKRSCGGDSWSEKTPPASSLTAIF
jgi:hypothetical protein